MAGHGSASHPVGSAIEIHREADRRTDCVQVTPLRSLEWSAFHKSPGGDALLEVVDSTELHLLEMWSPRNGTFKTGRYLGC